MEPNVKERLRKILKRDATNEKFLTDTVREMEQINQLLNLKEYTEAQKRLIILTHKIQFRDSSYK